MLLFDPQILPPQKGVFIVGGSVRDFLLGKSPLDYDIAVEGDAHAFASHLASSCNGHLVTMGKDDKAVFRVVKDPHTFDIVPIFGETIIDDLKRRDFTINAIAYELKTQRIIDPLDARRDLDARRIRLVGDRGFPDDPLRLLRTYRIGAVLDFEIAPDTRKAVKQHARLIATSAGERVQAEMNKLFETTRAHVYISQMTEDGLLEAMIPEFKDLRGCRQNEHHQFDVLAHTLAAFEKLEAILNKPEDYLPRSASRLQSHFDTAKVIDLKFALLLHDIGKPDSKTIDRNNRIHFYGHGSKSAGLAVHIAHRLKMSRHTTNYIDFIIRNHLRPLFLYVASQKKELGPKGRVRFFVKCGALTPDLLVHTIADIMGKSHTSTARDFEFIRFATELLVKYFNEHEAQTRRPPLITGHDLIEELALPPSPLFQFILRRVEEARLSGHIRTRTEALALARRIGSQSKTSSSTSSR